MEVEIWEPNIAANPAAPFIACKDEDEKKRLTINIVLTLRQRVSTTAIFFSSRLEAIREDEAYRLLGYDSWEDFVHSEFDRSVEEIDAKILSFSKLSPESEVPSLATHGGDRKSGNREKAESPKSYGTGSDYLRRRLTRDRPDLLADLESGKFKSLRQACVAAGIVKEKTRVEKAADLVRKMTEEERDEFLRLDIWDGRAVER